MDVHNFGNRLVSSLSERRNKPPRQEDGYANYQQGKYEGVDGTSGELTRHEVVYQTKDDRPQHRTLERSDSTDDDHEYWEQGKAEILEEGRVDRPYDLEIIGT